MLPGNWGASRFYLRATSQAGAFFLRRPVRARRLPIAVAQRLDIRVALPPGPGAYPVLAVLEGERAQTAKGGRRWRYYVSQAILQGRKQEAGSILRVSAPEVERTVLDAVRAEIGDERPNDAYLRIGVERVTIGQKGLLIRLSDQMVEDQGDRMISLPWTPTPSRRRREIFQGEGATQADIRPMRIEARRVFSDAYRRARLWLDRLVADPEVSIASIAMRERRTERSIRQTLSIAFLDPALVTATMEGRLPRGFGLTRLIDLPPCWREQWPALGLAAPTRS
jgi:hypothetical protein